MDDSYLTIYYLPDVYTDNKIMQNNNPKNRRTSHPHINTAFSGPTFKPYMQWIYYILPNNGAAGSAVSAKPKPDENSQLLYYT